MSTIEKLKQAEVERAEGWKARAEQIVADRKALEDEMAENAPETALGAQALAEVKQALAGDAMGRIAARVAARQAGA